MTKHEIGTREQWLAARRELLEREKELTRRSDELARERQELPWVRVDEAYGFTTSDGPKTPGGAVRRALAALGVPPHVRTRGPRAVHRLLVHGGQP